MNTEITTSITHGFEENDTLRIAIENGFWKVLVHWLLQKDLKRYEGYKITSVSNTTCSVGEKP